MRSAILADLQAGHLLKVLGVPSPLDWDLRGRAINIQKIIWRKLYFSGSDALLEPMQLCCTGNGCDPRLLRKQPRERDLGGG